MVVRLKQSAPFVVQGIPQTSQANPEVTFKGQWLAEKISDKRQSHRNRTWCKRYSYRQSFS